MGELAQLLLGIAAIITAGGTATASVITAARRSKTEGKRAAQGVVDRITDEDRDEDKQQAIRDLFEKFIEQQDKGGEDS